MHVRVLVAVTFLAGCTAAAGRRPTVARTRPSTPVSRPPQTPAPIRLSTRRRTRVRWRPAATPRPWTPPWMWQPVVDAGAEVAPEAGPEVACRLSDDPDGGDVDLPPAHHCRQRVRGVRQRDERRHHHQLGCGRDHRRVAVPPPRPQERDRRSRHEYIQSERQRPRHHRPLTIDTDGGRTPLVYTDSSVARGRSTSSRRGLDRGRLRRLGLDRGGRDRDATAMPPWGRRLSTNSAKWIWSAPSPRARTTSRTSRPLTPAGVLLLARRHHDRLDAGLPVTAPHRIRYARRSSPWPFTLVVATPDTPAVRGREAVGVQRSRRGCRGVSNSSGPERLK